MGRKARECYLSTYYYVGDQNHDDTMSLIYPNENSIGEVSPRLGSVTSASSPRGARGSTTNKASPNKKPRKKKKKKRRAKRSADEENWNTIENHFIDLTDPKVNEMFREMFTTRDEEVLLHCLKYGGDNAFDRSRHAQTARRFGRFYDSGRISVEKRSRREGRVFEGDMGAFACAQALESGFAAVCVVNEKPLGEGLEESHPTTNPSSEVI